MAETIQFICAVNNRTGHELKLQSQHLDWGKFEDSPNFPPVDSIAAHKEVKALRSSGRRGSSSGTEGTVVYQFGDNADQWVKIYWDVTWCSGCDNKVHTSTFDEDVSAEVDGFTGSGSVEDVTIKIIDGRG